MISAADQVAGVLSTPKFGAATVGSTQAVTLWSTVFCKLYLHVDATREATSASSLRVAHAEICEQQAVLRSLSDILS